MTTVVPSSVEDEDEDEKRLVVVVMEEEEEGDDRGDDGTCTSTALFVGAEREGRTLEGAKAAASLSNARLDVRVNKEQNFIFVFVVCCIVV